MTQFRLVSRTLLLLILASLSLPAFARTDDDKKTKDKPEEKWDTTLARGTTREIAFDTSEGTWMSVDISPDGKWIVFDLLAHIYRMPITGGNAECLTQKSGVALNAHPRFSPDGKYIAFITDRGGQDNLWVMNADGSNPHAVVEDKDLRTYEPAWTPDSRNILVVRHSVATGLEARSPSGIWLYNRDGGKGLEIVSSKDEKDADWPAVSSDGRYVYFQYAAGEPSSYAGHDDPLQGLFQIKRIELRPPAATHRAAKPDSLLSTSEQLSFALDTDGTDGT